MRAALALLAALSLAPVLRAEEPAAPTPPEEVARLLLSADASERARGEAALLDATARGAAPAEFVRRMTDTLRALAARTPEALDPWVERALGGTTEEREHAVRLLEAQGTAGLERLAQAQRRLRAALASGATAPPQAASGNGPVAAQPPEARLYEVRDLLERGAPVMDLLQLAARSARSDDVGVVSTRVLLTAPPLGHDAFRLALDQLRAEPVAVQPPGGKAEPVAKEGATAEPQPTGAAPAPSAPVDPLADPPAPPPPAPPPAPAPAAPAATRPPSKDAPYDLRLWAVSVPLREIEGLVPRTGVVNDLSGGPRGSKGPDGFRLVLGPGDWAPAWAQTALRSADALPLGEATHGIWVEQPLEQHLAPEVRYRRAAVRQQGGAWAVETDVLHPGLSVTTRMTGDTLAVEAAWVHVAQPMATERTRPAPEVGPIELDRPDWSVARRTAQVALDPQGTAALLVLPGLLPEADRRLVLVLSVLPR